MNRSKNALPVDRPMDLSLATEVLITGPSSKLKIVSYVRVSTIE